MTVASYYCNVACNRCYGGEEHVRRVLMGMEFIRSS